MIGHVTWGHFRAELIGVDEWRVTAGGREWPAMARALQMIYANDYGGPADGYYGQRILRDLATRMKGDYQFYPRSAPDPSEVP